MSKVNKNTNGQAFFENLQTSKNIAICTAGDYKSLNAGVALSLFINEKYNKKPFVVFTGKLDDIDTVYSEYADIRGTLSNKKLKIIIDYKNTDIDSLQWEKSGDDKLIMELGPINRGFDPKNIKFETVGEDVDMIITVGISDLENLGEFYKKNKPEFDSAWIVNIDINEANKRYGAVNIVYPQSDSIISLMLRKFADWKYTPNATVSAVLLYGLQQQNSSSPTQDVSIEIQSKADS